MAGNWNSVTVKVESETETGDGAAVLNSLAKMNVQTDSSRPLCSPQVKIEEVEIASGQEPGADNRHVLLNAAVMKARRLAAVKEVNRTQNRRMYLPGALANYGFDRDSGNLSLYHRSKLRYLLNMVSQRRKWHQASGVLGVLLGIPYESLTSAHVAGRWSDFAAAMEVLRRVDQIESKDLRIRRMFRVLSLQQPNARSRVKVHLELALYLISGGDCEAAYDELRPIVDDNRYREDPLANLCHGLNSYRLWYEKCMEDVSKHAVTKYGSRLETAGLLAKEGTGENNASEANDHDTYPERFRTHPRYPGGPRVAVQGVEDQSQSEESSGARMELDLSEWQASQRSIYEETDELGFVQTGEEFWRSVTVPWSSGLDQQLFPIPVQRDKEVNHYIVPMNDGRTRDLHAAAVKHLKQTLFIAPEMLPALLPLVQLLLAVHDIKGAVDEIDKCSHVLKNHFIPPSMKAALLESLDKKDRTQLAACYRDVLMRNPLSLSSLKGVINLHESGNLKTELLLEYICLHLDVDRGAVDTWKTLANCFLEVEENLQQPASLDVDTKLDKGWNYEDISLRPTSLTRENLQQLWSTRYRWWLIKHFHTSVHRDEVDIDGDKWLLAYKASCAVHIYGVRLFFVEHACKTLEQQNKHGELDLVEHHCERALNLFGAQE